MDKLIHDGKSVTISNDGATLISLLDIVHPAAKTLVDIAKSQDNEVGDGTTSVVMMAGELLKQSKTFIDEGMHSQIIIKGYREALKLCIDRIKEISVKIGDKSPEEKRDLLLKCAMTSMNSKIINKQKEFFAEMVVSAVEMLDENKDKQDIGIKKVTGGSVTDSFLVKGVCFRKTFSYAGFEQQPKSFKNPKILALNLELELKAEKDSAEIRLENPDDFQKIVDAEWTIIYDKLQKIVDTGAKVVLSKLPIGDLATQYFADRDIFCAGRVPAEDLERVVKATGGQIQTTANGLSEKILGTCGKFEEVQLGNDRYNMFTECPTSKSVTLVIRGGAAQYIEESARSLNDAIMIVLRAVKSHAIVAGGGAIEMELSRYLREHLRTIKGKHQLVINGFAKALEIIPKQLSENSGMDGTDILNKLRQIHTTKGEEGRWYGVDALNGGVADMFETFVWEPELVRLNVLTASTEAACTILSVDQTIRNPQSEQNQAAAAGRLDGTSQPPARGRGRGLNMGRGMRMMQGRGGK
jgi:T-complex protein 1 subunit eta